MNEKNNTDVEIESEGYDESEIIHAERKPRSRERGSDKKPRTYKASSMRNLTQFNQRPEEFAQYLKDEKGIDVTGSSGIVKALLVLGVVMLAGLGGFWLYNRYKNGEDRSIEDRY